MPLTAITTDSAPQPKGPYSQAIVANGFLFSAGFGPQDPATGAVPDGIEAQTTQLLRNVSAVLAAHDLDFSHVVKVTAHLQDFERDYALFNRAYREFVRPPFPARITVGSTLDAILVEIDVIAAVPA